MADDKMQPNLNDRPEQAKPEQEGQRAQQGQTGVASAAAQPSQRVAPGRKPLFRN
jgi:hypothetical protein